MSEPAVVMKRFCTVIQKRFGIVLNEKKYLLIKGRLQQRAKHLGYKHLGGYLEHVMREPEELDLCGELLATHTTQWFRELVHFQWLRPQLRQIVEKKGKVTIWSAACSSGEEVYSILFLAFLEGLRPDQIRILGSDVSDRALEKARELPNTPGFKKQVEQLKVKLGLGASGIEEKIETALKRSVKFKNFNLVQSDLNASLKFDFIFLRNVLIYFDSETTLQVCKKLSNHLESDGRLVTGLSESFQPDRIGMLHHGNSVYSVKNQESVPLPEKMPVPVPVPPAFKLPAEAVAVIEKIQENVDSVSTSSANVIPVPPAPIRMLIVEDSASMRKILRMIYEQIPGVEIVGETGSYHKAVSLYLQHSPNLVSLDMKLEDGTGMDFLNKVSISSNFHKCRVLLLTDSGASDGPLVMDAMAMGARYYVQKPKSGEMKEFIPMLQELVGGFLPKVKSNSSDVTTMSRAEVMKMEVDPEFILVGSSTGGTEIVKDMIAALNRDAPPILVVQHMPEAFTRVYAQRLQQITKRPVHEVRGAMPLERGSAYIASGGLHLQMTKKGDEYWVESNDGVPVNRFKPSVSVLFSSAQALGVSDRCVAVMLTGMGRDGAEEMLHLNRSGALTMAQSKESCAVYGMPAAAVELGAVDYIDSPAGMIELINKLLDRKSIKKAA